MWLLFQKRSLILVFVNKEDLGTNFFLSVKMVIFQQYFFFVMRPRVLFVTETNDARVLTVINDTKMLIVLLCAKDYVLKNRIVYRLKYDSVSFKKKVH